MPQGSPSPADVIRLEPMGRFKQTQNGNVRLQGGSYLKSKAPQPPRSPINLRTQTSTLKSCLEYMSIVYRLD